MLLLLSRCGPEASGRHNTENPAPFRRAGQPEPQPGADDAGEPSAPQNLKLSLAFLALDSLRSAALRLFCALLAATRSEKSCRRVNAPCSESRHHTPAESPGNQLSLSSSEEKHRHTFRFNIAIKSSKDDFYRNFKWNKKNDELIRRLQAAGSACASLAR